MSHTPTAEQQFIIDAARDTDENLLVNALAGAAKTSTLIMIAEALPSSEFLTLAFNKRIQVEMQERLPSNCTALTLNSLGHRAWGAFLRKRLTLDASKMYRLLDNWVKENVDEAEKEDFYSLEYDDLYQALKSVRTAGWVPDSYRHALPHKRLMDDDELREWLDFEPTNLQWSALVKIISLSITQAFSGYIDYDDQIYMPTLFPASFPRYQNVMIDEAQDLSALNHAMLRKLLQGARLFAVGDPYQAIYGFRGAHENSMSLMREEFDMHELGLSISFRCPIAIVKEARWRAPHMEYPEWAKTGSVKRLESWTSIDIPEDAAIICRNNAPLFNMAIKLIKAGRHVEVVGNDLSKRFVKILESLGDPDMPKEQLLLAIESWAAKELARGKKMARVKDMEDCLRSFALNAETLGACITTVKKIFSAQGPLKLMTGHKAKGLEYHDVFILDRELLDLQPGSQDRNLLYVMQTRAMNNLTYITTGGFIDGASDE